MKKILLVADTPTPSAFPIQTQLEAEGFSVEPMTQMQSDWDVMLNQINPDVILMEISEDQYTDKYHWCHQLRQEPQTEHIPIVLLGTTNQNGAHNLHYLLEGLHAGANDYLQTPYDMAELVGKIEAALRLKGLLEKSHGMTQQLNTLNDELYQRNIQVEKEMHIARQLQQSLLPPALPIPDDEDDESVGPLYTKLHYLDEKLRITGIYLPCDALGGDLYDVLKLHDNSLGISVTDVSGHGLPAGFITAIFKTCLYRITHQMSDPAQVMYHLNNELYDIVKTGDYVTSVYARVELDSLSLECSGAGHPYPFYYCAKTGEMTRLQENGTPLVWVPNMDYPKARIQLAPGDKVFFFTDGVSELRNMSDEMFSEERIAEVLTEGMQQKILYLTDYLIGQLSDFTEGRPLEDDISMMLIEVL